MLRRFRATTAPSVPRPAKSLAALLALASLLAGCAGKAADGGAAPGQLSTHIYDDGTKLFVYNLRSDERLFALSPLDYRAGFSDGKRVYSPEELRKRSARRLRSGLQRSLESSQYCREGFITLSSYASYGVASLRGECRDAATASDRQRFPNLDGNAQR